MPRSTDVAHERARPIHEGAEPEQGAPEVDEEQPDEEDGKNRAISHDIVKGYILAISL